MFHHYVGLLQKHSQKCHPSGVGSIDLSPLQPTLVACSRSNRGGGWSVGLLGFLVVEHPNELERSNTGGVRAWVCRISTSKRQARRLGLNSRSPLPSARARAEVRARRQLRGGAPRVSDPGPQVVSVPHFGQWTRSPSSAFLTFLFGGGFPY